MRRAPQHCAFIHPPFYGWMRSGPTRRTATFVDLGWSKMLESMCEPQRRESPKPHKLLAESEPVLRKETHICLFEWTSTGSFELAALLCARSSPPTQTRW